MIAIAFVMFAVLLVGWLLAPNGEAKAESKPAAEAMTDAPPVVPAKISADLELGPACDQCGGMMQRTGSCYTCSSCGNNTGCG